jgi:ferrous iron transport protein A
MKPLQTQSLNHLLPGQQATIHAIEVEFGLQRRLYALGFRKGQTIEILRRAWLSGPLHIRIGTTEVMLRRRDAMGIEISHAVGNVA